MRSHVVAAAALAGLLVASGAALSLLPASSAEEEHAPAHAEEGAHAPARSGHGHGGGAHPWKGGTGTVPDLATALLSLERRASIVITNDSEFNPANGVRAGSGTYDDPFVISGWYVDTILVADTSRAFEVKENYVARILVLDWTGQGGYVHHNHLANLRTNRNVERTGDPTAAVIESNLVRQVEELRHFDGEVRNNTIGEPGLAGLLENGVVLNVAGLNGAGIHDNVIHGGVDMKLHGHHHSDAPGLHSHNHGQADAAQGEDHVEDHQVRHIDFLFARNRIVDDGFGLRYNDLNHAGDDRTATSEQEPDLEKPHVHHTRVVIADNVVEGATLRVVVLNSADERHLPGETGELVVERNRVLKPAAGDGLVVQDVRNARVHLRGNVVEKGSLQIAGTSAILLQRFANATVVVEGNSFGDYRYGVRASAFDPLTTWAVLGNKGPARYPVYWDDSVPNAPAGAAEEEHAHEGHEHGGHEQGSGHEAETALVAAVRRLGA